jgi:hypothetical protein
MAVIRPFNPPVVNPQQTPRPASTPAQTRSATEARAAQRAFFQQALGDATPVRAAPVAAPVAHSQPAPATRDIIRPLPDEPPSRPMRPGSFIDIKV